MIYLFQILHYLFYVTFLFCRREDKDITEMAEVSINLILIKSTPPDKQI